MLKPLRTVWLPATSNCDVTVTDKVRIKQDSLPLTFQGMPIMPPPCRFSSCQSGFPLIWGVGGSTLPARKKTRTPDGQTHMSENVTLSLVWSAWLVITIVTETPNMDWIYVRCEHIPLTKHRNNIQYLFPDPEISISIVSCFQLSILTIFSARLVLHWKQHFHRNARESKWTWNLFISSTVISGSWHVPIMRYIIFNCIQTTVINHGLLVKIACFKT